MDRKNNYTIYLIIFLLGIVHWYLFMGYGNPGYNSFDWRTSHQVFAVIKESIETFKIPYYVTQYGDDTLTESVKDIRFLAWADIKSVSPQLLLMKFISVPSFIVFNTLFFFSIGYWGVIKWIKELKLSNTAAAYLTVLWCFNGYLTSKMGIGWLGTNFGYFIIPNFLWIVYKIIKKDYYTTRENLILALEFAFLMFFTIINGSGKCLYQFGLVSLMVMIWFPKRLPTYFISLCLTFILVSFWFWPGALFSVYTNAQRVMFAGYGFNYDYLELTTYLEGGAISSGINVILNIVQHFWISVAVIYNASFDGQWEYNIYVGYIGIIVIIAALLLLIKNNKELFSLDHNIKTYLSTFLSVFFLLALSGVSVLYFKAPKLMIIGLIMLIIIGGLLIYYYPKHQKELQHSQNHLIVLIIPLLTVTLLSIYLFKAYIFHFVQDLVDFPAFDRTPGKLFGYVFYILILLSATQFDRLFSFLPKKYISSAKWAVVAVLFANLMVNSYEWSVINTEQNYVDVITARNLPQDWRDPRGIYDVKIYDIQEDNNYKQVVNISYLVSGITFIFTFIFYLFARYRPKLIKLK